MDVEQFSTCSAKVSKARAQRTVSKLIVNS